MNTPTHPNIGSLHFTTIDTPCGPVRVLLADSYAWLKARNDKHEEWVNTQRKKTKCRKCKGKGFYSPYPQGFDNGVRDMCLNCKGKGFVLGWASYKPEDIPADVPQVTNEERSLLEVYEFLRDQPGRYFSYVLHNSPSQAAGGKDAAKVGDRIANFLGDKLGVISWAGSWYHVNGFGTRSTRQNVRVTAINGLVYSGVYFVSSGDYVRLKVVSSSKPTSKPNNRANGAER